MRFLIAILALGFLLACGSDNDDDGGGSSNIPSYDGFTLVWSDEFDDSTIDPSNWTYETGDGTDFGLPSGWGNNEKQIYQQDISNASIREDGDRSVLSITAFQNGPGSYTSAKLTSRGLRSIRYGRIEASMKLPKGQGIWPAFWMLGDNFQDPIGWPGCGEIDIMEILGHEPNVSYSTIHYVLPDDTPSDFPRGNIRGEVQGTYTLPSGDFSDDYHTWTLDWTPESLIFSVDGNVVNQVAIDEDMNEFLRSFYLIFNVAVGGRWPGDPDETTVFPQSMYVDYVRVYSIDDLSPADPPALDIVAETLGLLIDETISVHAIADDFTAFGEIAVNSYGGGGEPYVIADDNAIDGMQSLKFIYPGTNWGGGFFILEEGVDFTSYASGNLVFALKYPTTLKDAEIKLESSNQNTEGAVFLADYTPTDLGDGWMEYVIPVSDFTALGLDLSDLRIPFALWNPHDVSSTTDAVVYFQGEILVDNIHFTQ